MERYVECESRGLTLRGMLHVPDQRPGKVPFVILFHGFCDDRNEINFVHTELSRRLCERGIASVRFDFAGSGDSDGRFEDMTVSSEVEDGLAILDYVKSLDFVDQSRIAIHGLSMGGCVASMVAGLRDADVCALSLWIPSRRLRSVAYYCVLCATLQGLVTPSVAHDFPSWTYFAFFLSHGVTVITALYLPLALEWKPARWDFLWAFLLANAYLVAIHPVNMLLGTNYGFTVATPAGGSVLDFLGPWPWYLLWMQVPALALMYLLTLPFRRYPKGRTGSSLFRH